MSTELEPMKFESENTGDTGTRGRIVAGIVAAMLIALAGGLGFGLGRSVDDSSDDAALAPGDAASPTTAAADETASTEHPDEPEVSGAAPTDPPATDEPSAGDGLDETPLDTIAPIEQDVVAAEYGGFTSGGWGYVPFAALPSDLLFERTTDNGMTLRAHLGETWETIDEGYGFDGWSPAPWCFESGQLRIAVAGNGVIDLGGVGWYSEPFKGKSISWIRMGMSDGQPQWVIVVQTAPETTGVTVLFEDGNTDTTAPQNGIALLTVPTKVGTSYDDLEGYPHNNPPVFEVTFDGGPEPVSIGSDAVPVWEDPEYRASCSPPPPALPDAGEQPADPAAAEAEIIDVMRLLYGGSEDQAPGAVYIDDDTGVADAREQVSGGSFSSEADSASATIEEVVFTAPDEAWFRYRVDTNGIGLTDRYGIAVLVDGAWLITRNTVCQDLSMAGGDCGGGWHTITPPSALITED